MLDGLKQFQKLQTCRRGTFHFAAEMTDFLFHHQVSRLIIISTVISLLDLKVKNNQDPLERKVLSLVEPTPISKDHLSLKYDELLMAMKNQQNNSHSLF